MHFPDAHASLPIPRAEENKRALMKVEEGVCLALETRRRMEEDHTRLEAEE